MAWRSIAVEEQFYLVWPWLVLLLPRRWLGVAFTAVLTAAPLCRLGFAPLGIDAVYRLTLCRMDLLAAGALLALFERRDQLDPATREGHEDAHHPPAASIAAK